MHKNRFLFLIIAREEGGMDLDALVKVLIAKSSS